MAIYQLFKCFFSNKSFLNADREDEDTYIEPYTGNEWIYIGELEESHVWKRPDSRDGDDESSEGPIKDRRGSQGSTESEKGFRKKYQAATHRMVHRKSSGEMYKRMQSKSFGNAYRAALYSIIMYYIFFYISDILLLYITHHLGHLSGCLTFPSVNSLDVFSTNKMKVVLFLIHSLPRSGRVSVGLRQSTNAFQASLALSFLTFYHQHIICKFVNVCTYMCINTIFVPTHDRGFFHFFKLHLIVHKSCNHSKMHCRDDGLSMRTFSRHTLPTSSTFTWLFIVFTL